MLIDPKARLQQRSISYRVLLVLLAAYTASGCTSDPCVQADWHSLAELRYGVELDRIENDWMSDARMCDLGEYVILTPRDGSNASISVLKKVPPGQPGLRPSFSILPTEDGYRVTNASGTGQSVSVVTDNRLSAFSRIDYGELSATKTDWTVIDSEFDGVLDLRLQSEDGAARTLAWMEDEWREVIRENGVRGVMIGGRFQPISRVDD